MKQSNFLLILNNYNTNCTMSHVQENQTVDFERLTLYTNILLSNTF